MTRNRRVSRFSEMNVFHGSEFIWLLRSSVRTYGRTKSITRGSVRRVSFWNSEPTEIWGKVASDAERIVGYPTSFMSLRCLLSDEISNVAMHVRKLVGTRHPLLKTARGLVYDGKNSTQTRGLIVLLVSKAAGPASLLDDLNTHEAISGIYPSQRALAEITEMIYTATLIHRGVVNMADLGPEDVGTEPDLLFGNKMAVLSGDFLLANASTGLAELRNTRVVEIISSAIRDMMVAEFVPKWTPNTLNDCNDIPETFSLEKWKEKTFLSVGSLVAKSCQSAMELAKQSRELQDDMFEYGKNISYLRQIYDDINHFKSDDIKEDEDLRTAYMSSAPVYLYLNKYGEIFLQNNSHNLSINKFHEAILQSDVLQQCKEIQEHISRETLKYLNRLPESDARNTLSKMVDAVKSS